MYKCGIVMKKDKKKKGAGIRSKKQVSIITRYKKEILIIVILIIILVVLGIVFSATNKKSNDSGSGTLGTAGAFSSDRSDIAGEAGTSSSGGSGSVYATSTPSDARVYIDNDYKGKSPITVFGLTAGEHKIKFLYNGYKGYIGAFSVSGSETASVNIELTPITDVTA